MSAAFVALGMTAIGGFAYEFWVRTDLLRLKRYEYHSSEFFRLSTRVLGDENVPEHVIETLEGFRALMCFKAFSRKMVFSLLDGRKPDAGDLRRQDELRQSETYKELDAFHERHPELADAFVLAAAHALRATTYRSRFAGLLIRRLSLFDLRANPKRALSVAAVYGPKGRMAHA